jgi:hypothetical protein
MSFGKRPPSAPPPSATPDPHDRRKVIPDEAWSGPHGDLLRTLGMSPSDESNLVANESSMNARLDESKLRLEERNLLAQRNIETRLQGAQVRPFFLIPDPCWQGATGVFLMAALDLYPYDDWNVMYLAGDERTSVVLDIAAHPNGNVPQFVEAAQKFMAKAQTDLRLAHDEAGATGDYAAFSERLNDIRERVKGLAVVFSRSIVELWEKRGASHAP